MLVRLANTYRAGFSGLSRENWLLSTVMLINRAGTMAIPFMSMYLTQALHRSLKEAGLIITLFGVGSVAGASLGGWLTDKVGFRKVQIASTTIAGVLFILFSYVTHFGLLCALTILLAVVAEAFRPANFTAVAAYSSPQNLTRSYSLNRLAINMGWAAGSSVGGFVAAINYHLLFWVEGLVYILVGILIWYLLPSQKQAQREKKHRTPLNVKKPWQDGWYMRFLAVVVLFNTCFFLVFRLVPVFWKAEWGINERAIGLLLGLNGVIIVFLEMILVSRWEKRESPMIYIVAGSLANAIAYAFLMLPGGAHLGYGLAMVLFITFGEMLALPFFNSIAMKRSNEYNRGQYAAAYTISWSAAIVIGPSGGAWIAETFGYRWLWATLIGISLFCAWAFSRFKLTEPNAPHETGT